MDKPRPVPFPTPFVVKKGSNILFRFASGIPGPVSATKKNHVILFQLNVDVQGSTLFIHSVECIVD